MMSELEELRQQLIVRRNWVIELATSATSIHFVSEVPGYLPQDMINFIRSAAKQQLQLLKKLERKKRRALALINTSLRKLDAGLGWLCDPLVLHHLDEIVSEMEEIKEELVLIEQKLDKELKEARSYRVKLNFNSPAPARVYYSREVER